MLTVEILIQNAVDELRYYKDGDPIYRTDCETYIACDTKHGFQYLSLDGKYTPFFAVHSYDDGFAPAEELPYYFVLDDEGFYPQGAFVVFPLSPDAINAGWLEAEYLPSPDLDCDFTIDLGWWVTENNYDDKVAQ